MKKKHSINRSFKAAKLQKYRLRSLLHDDKQIREVGEMLSFLRQDYPDFWRWYNNMILPGLTDGSRQVIVADDYGNRLAVAMILKNTPSEKKICTLCVFDEYKGHKIGTQFVKLAARRLGTQTPLITVSSRHLKEFEAFFKRLPSRNQVHFVQAGSYEDYYRDGMTEYTFNGHLPAPLEKAANG